MTPAPVVTADVVMVVTFRPLPDREREPRLAVRAWLKEMLRAHKLRLIDVDFKPAGDAPPSDT